MRLEDLCLPAGLIERFWAKVEKSEGCWEWRGSRNAKGYGKMCWHVHYVNHAIFAHRLSYLLEHEQIADGLFVCHRCDNTGCVNPAHLFAGTNGDNQRDSYAKGRTPRPGPRGTRAARGVWSDEQRQAIIMRYRNGESLAALARAFGATSTGISHVVFDQPWLYGPGQEVPERRGSPCGERHGAARLTAAQVRAIRASYAAGEPRSVLATRYSVSYACIWDITRGNRWKHIVD